MKRALKYSPALADKICAFAAKADHPAQVSEQAEMPSAQQLESWLLNYPDFFQKWQKARFLAAERLSAEIVQIADAATAETLNLSKLRIDARKWLAGRLGAEMAQQEKTAPPPKIERIETILIDPKKTEANQ